jgi:hypothetical protein
MRLGYFAAACLSVAISGIAVGDAVAQDVVKIGVIIPMTGGFTSVGREVAAVPSYTSSSMVTQSQVERSN